MSGVEIVALVAAIVSASVAGTELLVKYKKERSSRKWKNANKKIKILLRRDKTYFARPGEAFAKGRWWKLS